MEPYFECKDDLRIGVELAKRLGIDPEIIEPWSWKQEIFNQVADARVMNADGKTLEPLVTITEDDLREFEVEGVPQVGRIALREFKEKGIRSEEHTSELQSLMRSSYAVFCLKKQKDAKQTYKNRKNTQ